MSYERFVRYYVVPEDITVPAVTVRQDNTLELKDITFTQGTIFAIPQSDAPHSKHVAFDYSPEEVVKVEDKNPHFFNIESISQIEKNSVEINNEQFNCLRELWFDARSCSYEAREYARADILVEALGIDEALETLRQQRDYYDVPCRYALPLLEEGVLQGMTSDEMNEILQNTYDDVLKRRNDFVEGYENLATEFLDDASYHLNHTKDCEWHIHIADSISGGLDDLANFCGTIVRNNDSEYEIVEISENDVEEREFETRIVLHTAFNLDEAKEKLTAQDVEYLTELYGVNEINDISPASLAVELIHTECIEVVSEVMFPHTVDDFVKQLDDKKALNPKEYENSKTDEQKNRDFEIAEEKLAQKEARNKGKEICD